MTVPDAQRTQPIPPAVAPTRVLTLCVLGLTIAGLLLRLFCARGDLWLDEIWSLQNLTKIHHVGDIFWGISQNNNHFLNSLWMWVVGPNAPPVLIRLEAIVCGTLTIPVAAQLCGRAGPAARLAGAALTAGSALFVHYGSEARGYAGLILMIFIAAEALERFVESLPRPIAGPQRAEVRSSRLAFGAAVGFGALFHLTMLTASASLFAATMIRLAIRGLSLRQLAVAAIDLAIPAVLGAVPALGFVLAGALNTHKIELGTQIPFSFKHLAQGAATLVEATLGLSYELAAWAALAIALVGICLAATVTPTDRRVLPLTALLLPPLGAALAHVPGVHIARFHLIGALGLVLLAGEAFARLSAARKRFAALVLAMGLAGGNALHVSQLLIQGRSNDRALVLHMESEGNATYGSNMPAEISRTVRFYDAPLGGHLSPVLTPDWCKAAPDWYILSDDPAGEAPQRAFGPAQCAVNYRREMVAVPASLSGLRLALYRRLP